MNGTYIKPEERLASVCAVESDVHEKCQVWKIINIVEPCEIAENVGEGGRKQNS